MTHLKLAGACAGLLALSACAYGGGGGDNGGTYFDNGNDVSFLDAGAQSCPGTVQAGLQGSSQYPLRCGPQTQVVGN